ncbi:MAG: ABC transporter ATP-binding protein [Acidobacteria bacterium]|nr:ABC transporter ATP-binding protein [Acidobacteriota bacterium]
MRAIDLQQVSKRFLIHKTREFAVPRLGRKSSHTVEPFWAVRDVSLQVEPGEKVALVGGNGAGKSTLLGIVAGIITETSGKVSRNGRIGALLELGTGFHSDLTGRENIHLNASLLGFRPADVKRELDSIVDFAELKDFLDEPVRTYSSGMIARLGFSVAIHVDPDILIMDEVLSVGDRGFQAKCKEKIADLAGRGRTLLFVSHQMSAVLAMCPRTVWLDKGRVRMDGPSQKVVAAYEGAVTSLPRATSVEVR